MATNKQTKLQEDIIQQIRIILSIDKFDQYIITDAIKDLADLATYASESATTLELAHLITKFKNACNAWLANPNHDLAAFVLMANNTIRKYQVKLMKELDTATLCELKDVTLDNEDFDQRVIKSRDVITNKLLSHELDYLDMITYLVSLIEPHIQFEIKKNEELSSIIALLTQFKSKTKDEDKWSETLKKIIEVLK